MANLGAHAIDTGLKLAARVDVDVKRTLFNDVEKVTSITLANDLLKVSYQL